MDTLAVILSLVLVGGTLALILYPLWNRPQTRTTRDASGNTVEELEARYQASLAAIRDLMFDYEMGKVTQEDYDTLLTNSKLEAAQIRRQIDQMSQATEVDLDPNIDVEIEKLVAQLRTDSVNGNETLLKEVDKEIEILKHAQHDTVTCPNCSSIAQVGDTFCSKCGQSLENVKVDKNTCPECGTSIQPDDAFCAKCGTELNNNLATRNPQAVDAE
jgi:DNA-directed RNA polymerase subunit RPC12/RpoP